MTGTVPQNGKHSNHLEDLLKEIEEHLSWGNGKNWRHKDFEVLHQKIWERTNAQISPTTLKRLWGKLPYNSSPNTYTLNTLAQFVGYENWVIYQSSHASPGSRGSKALSWINFPYPKIGKKIQLALAALFLLSAALLFYSLAVKKQPHKLSQEIIDTISFSSYPVTTGVPNTIVFKYDVQQVPSDNIQIQQNWDEKLKFPISKDQSEITSTYYYPGYWKAKLVIDDQVVLEQDVHIKSNGWLITIYDEPIPRYIKPTELLDNGTLGIKDSIQTMINQQKSGPPLAIHQYVEDFGGLDGDNFSFDITYKNTYQEGDGVCQFTQIFLDCTEGRFSIPLSQKGCVGNLSVRLNDLHEDGKNNDLSNFGTEFRSWQKLKFVVKDKRAEIHLNQNLIYQGQYHQNVGEVAGIRIYFTGSGAIDDIKLSNASGQVVYEELF